MNLLEVLRPLREAPFEQFAGRPVDAQWLVTNGLVFMSIPCPRCEGDMHVRQASKLADGHQYHCKTCKKQRALRCGARFGRMAQPLRRCLPVVWCWANGQSRMRANKTCRSVPVNVREVYARLDALDCATKMVAGNPGARLYIEDEGDRTGKPPAAGDVKEHPAAAEKERGHPPDGGDESEQPPTGVDGSGHPPDEGDGSGHSPGKGDGSGHPPDEGDGSGHPPEERDKCGHQPHGGNGSGHQPDGGDGSGHSPEKGDRSGHPPKGGNAQNITIVDVEVLHLEHNFTHNEGKPDFSTTDSRQKGADDHHNNIKKFKRDDISGTMITDQKNKTATILHRQPGTTSTVDTFGTQKRSTGNTDTREDEDDTDDTDYDQPSFIHESTQQIPIEQIGNLVQENMDHYPSILKHDTEINIDQDEEIKVNDVTEAQDGAYEEMHEKRRAAGKYRVLSAVPSRRPVKRRKRKQRWLPGDEFILRERMLDRLLSECGVGDKASQRALVDETRSLLNVERVPVYQSPNSGASICMRDPNLTDDVEAWRTGPAAEDNAAPMATTHPVTVSAHTAGGHMLRDTQRRGYTTRDGGLVVAIATTHPKDITNVYTGPGHHGHPPQQYQRGPSYRSPDMTHPEAQHGHALTSHQHTVHGVEPPYNPSLPGHQGNDVYSDVMQSMYQGYNNTGYWPSSPADRDVSGLLHNMQPLDLSSGRHGNVVPVRAPGAMEGMTSNHGAEIRDAHTDPQMLREQTCGLSRHGSPERDTAENAIPPHLTVWGVHNMPNIRTIGAWKTSTGAAADHKTPDTVSPLATVNTHVTPHDTHVTPHHTHVTPHDTHVTPHHTHVTPHDTHVTTHHTHVTPHDTHVTTHQTPVTPNHSHVTPHHTHVTSHHTPVTPNHSHVTPHHTHVSPHHTHVTPQSSHVAAQSTHMDAPKTRVRTYTVDLTDQNVQTISNRMHGTNYGTKATEQNYNELLTKRHKTNRPKKLWTRFENNLLLNTRVKKNVAKKTGVEKTLEPSQKGRNENPVSDDVSYTRLDLRGHVVSIRPICGEGNSTESIQQRTSPALCDTTIVHRSDAEESATSPLDQLGGVKKAPPRYTSRIPACNLTMSRDQPISRSLTQPTTSTSCNLQAKTQQTTSNVLTTLSLSAGTGAPEMASHIVRTGDSSAVNRENHSRGNKADEDSPLIIDESEPLETITLIIPTRSINKNTPTTVSRRHHTLFTEDQATQTSQTVSTSQKQETEGTVRGGSLLPVPSDTPQSAAEEEPAEGPAVIQMPVTSSRVQLTHPSQRFTTTKPVTHAFIQTPATVQSVSPAETPMDPLTLGTVTSRVLLPAQPTAYTLRVQPQTSSAPPVVPQTNHLQSPLTITPISVQGTPVLTIVNGKLTLVPSDTLVEVNNGNHNTNNAERNVIRITNVQQPLVTMKPEAGAGAKNNIMDGIIDLTSTTEKTGNNHQPNIQPPRHRDVTAHNNDRVNCIPHLSLVMDSDPEPGGQDRQTVAPTEPGCQGDSLGTRPCQLPTLLPKTQLKLGRNQATPVVTWSVPPVLPSTGGLSVLRRHNQAAIDVIRKNLRLGKSLKITDSGKYEAYHKQLVNTYKKYVTAKYRQASYRQANSAPMVPIQPVQPIQNTSDAQQNTLEVLRTLAQIRRGHQVQPSPRKRAVIPKRRGNYVTIRNNIAKLNNAVWANSASIRDHIVNQKRNIHQEVIIQNGSTSSNAVRHNMNQDTHFTSTSNDNHTGDDVSTDDADISGQDGRLNSSEIRAVYLREKLLKDAINKLKTRLANLDSKEERKKHMKITSKKADNPNSETATPGQNSHQDTQWEVNKRNETLELANGSNSRGNLEKIADSVARNLFECADLMVTETELEDETLDAVVPMPTEHQHMATVMNKRCDEMHAAQMSLTPYFDDELFR